MSRKTNLIVALVLVSCTAFGLLAYAQEGSVSGTGGATDTEKAVLADRHTALGLECTACHTDGKFGEVPMEKCLECHGPYEKLAERTKDVGDMNPHNSHYIDLDCNLCHHGHKADENFCATCH